MSSILDLWINRPTSENVNAPAEFVSVHNPVAQSAAGHS